VTLDPDSYKKREKIYKFGKWIDTKPLKYNLLELSENKSNIGKKDKSFNKLLINNINKRSFSTYVRKSIKIYKRYILKKFLDKIIDILIYLFIIFILIIVLLVYFLYYQYIYLNNINDITNDFNNITNGLDLINSNLNNTELTNNNFWTQKVNNFVDLFKDNNKNTYDLKIKSTNNLIEYPSFNSKQKLFYESCNTQNLNTLNELHKLHYNELEQEIDQLNIEISELKIKLLNYEIDKLDIINFVKNIADEMSNDVNKMNNEIDSIWKRYSV
jgi:hypothetical protein